jgi:hypothetical protein
MTAARVVLIQCEYVGPSGYRCDRETTELSDRWCAIHCPADELDLGNFHAARARAAKYTLAKGLPSAAETLVRLAGDPDAGAGANIKAASEVLDRGGIPRVSATVLQADITHREGRTAGQLVRERLGAMMGRVADREETDLPEPPAAIPVVIDAAVESESPAEPPTVHGEGDSPLGALSRFYGAGDIAEPTA